MNGTSLPLLRQHDLGLGHHRGEPSVAAGDVGLQHDGGAAGVQRRADRAHGVAAAGSARRSWSCSRSWRWPGSGAERADAVIPPMMSASAMIAPPCMTSRRLQRSSRLTSSASLRSRAAGDDLHAHELDERAKRPMLSCRSSVRAGRSGCGRKVSGGRACRAERLVGRKDKDVDDGAAKRRENRRGLPNCISGCMLSRRGDRPAGVPVPNAPDGRRS